jgi:hypothetical protein
VDWGKTPMMEVHTVSAHEFTYNYLRVSHATSIPVPSNTDVKRVVSTIEISIKLREHNSSKKTSTSNMNQDYAIVTVEIRNST